MTENTPNYRFLLETRSQQMHRLEAIRLRRELLERESKKPPAMRFGIGKGLSSSPPPRPISPVAKGTPSRAASVQSHSYRSRTKTCETKRNCAASWRATLSVARSEMASGRAPRLRSCRCSPVASRVVSPVPIGPSEENATLRVLKRLRSISQVRLHTASRSRTPRVHSPLHAASFSDGARGCKGPVTSPLIPSGVLSARRGVVTPQRSVSNTPLSEGSEKVEQRLLCIKSSPAGSNNDRCPPCRFSCLPRLSTMASPRCLSNEAFSQTPPTRTLSRSTERERSSVFRASVFPMPRTPKCRSSLAASLSPSFPTEIKKPNYDIVSLSDAHGEKMSNEHCSISITPSADEEAMNHLSITNEETVAADAADPVSVDEYLDGDNVSARCSERAVNIGEGIVPDVSLTFSASRHSDLITLTPFAAEDVTEEGRSEVVASTTVIEQNCISIKREEVETNDSTLRQLTFETAVSPNRTQEVEETVSHEPEAVNGDGKNMYCRQQRSEGTLPMIDEGVMLPLTACELNGGTQLSVVQQSIATSPSIPQPQASTVPGRQRLDVAFNASEVGESVEKEHEDDDDDGGRRKSLVLVTGEPPVLFTPALQEPHTPTPRDINEPLLAETSPLPRPVSFVSQLESVSPARLQKRRCCHRSHGTPSCSSQMRVLSQPLCSLSLADGTQMGELAPVASSLQEGDVMATEDGKTLSPAPSTPRSCALGRKRLRTEEPADCSEADALQEVDQLGDVDSPFQCHSWSSISAQVSETVTDGTYTTQRGVNRPRRVYYDYNYWKRYLHEVTTKSAEKERQKSAKRARQSETDDAPESPFDHFTIEGGALDRTKTDMSCSLSRSSRHHASVKRASQSRSPVEPQ
ncbi:hypothetical protein TRVL_05272 [Trypanosoma vivax]|nr:hypothetical protein TRVL_05272 [Trypanosoma vivax]